MQLSRLGLDIFHVHEELHWISDFQMSLGISGGSMTLPQGLWMGVGELAGSPISPLHGPGLPHVSLYFCLKTAKQKQV